MHKVKYNRKEYREEYLRSDHWKTLRSLIVSSGVACFKCNVNPSTDAHHMNYRNIVDVKLNDLVPLCRECHELIEEAKSIKLIRKAHSIASVLKVTRESLDAEKRRLATKVHLPDKVIQGMILNGPKCYKLIFGFIKKTVTHQRDWKNILVTEKQLFTIYGIACRNWEKNDYRPRIIRRVTSGKSSLHY